ncbi:MAG: hypothetical protein IKH22_10070 [Prevotella sp.]|nr:hypothetical protein [Prevotella sp.]
MEKKAYIAPQVAVRIINIEAIMQIASAGDVPVDNTPGKNEGTAKESSEIWSDFNE